MAEPKSNRLWNCVRCGALYQPGNAQAMYCRKACKVAACRDRLGYRAEEKLAAARKRLCRALCRLALLKLMELRAQRRKTRKEARKAASLLRRSRPCEVCGKPLPQRCHKFCSTVCYRKSHGFREAKAKDRKAGKLMRAGVAVVERFSAVEILKRDGWRCQICGISTPQKLRGTCRPNAPEIDHVVAIGNGGEHTRANVQCACRACNGRKHDGPAKGQIRLL